MYGSDQISSGSRGVSGIIAPFICSGTADYSLLTPQKSQLNHAAMSIHSLSLSQIKEIIAIKEQIAALEQKLTQIVNENALAEDSIGKIPVAVKKKRRKTGWN